MPIIGDAVKGFMILYDPVVLPGFITTNIDIDRPIVDHIRVTSNYTHTFITGTALSAMVSLMTNGNSNLGPTMTLTASSVLRVQ